jgi:hypothetical protein
MEIKRIKRSINNIKIIVRLTNKTKITKKKNTIVKIYKTVQQRTTEICGGKK